MRLFQYILALAAVSAASLAHAQPGGNPLGGRDSLVLENERIEDVIESEKPFIKPPYQEIKKGPDSKNTYNSRDFYVGTNFEPPPPDIKPAELPKPDPFTNQFIKLGIGRFVTPYANLYLHNGKDATRNYGLDFTHLSAHRDKVPLRRFREDYGTAQGRIMTDAFTAAAKLYVFNTSYFNYADSAFIDNAALREDSLRTGFTRLALGVSLASSPTLGERYFYDAGLQVKSIFGNRGNTETQLRVLPTGGYKITDNVSIQLNTELNVITGKVGGLNQGRFYAAAVPFIYFNNGTLSLKGGIQTNFFANRADSPSVSNLFPIGEITYQVAPDAFTLVAGLSSGMDINSYYDQLFVNRYLGQEVLIRPTVERFRVYLGGKGNLNHGLDYSVTAYYKQVANQLIYRTFDSVYFRPLYDSLTRVTGLHAELNYDKGEHLRTGTAVTINLFNTANTDSLTPNAFFLTPIRVDFFAAYKFLEDKLTARAELSLFGATPVGIDGEGELIRRNLFPNISVYGDYRITKGFSVYLWAGNLIGINYQRWLNYPERGFDIQGGITLAF